MSNQPDEVIFFNEPPQPINPANPYGISIYRQGTHERFGPIILSIQAGYGNYADPRDTYLPSLADYSRVEIAMWDLREESRPDPWDKRQPPFQSLGAWTKPRLIGLEGFDELLDGDDVEGWVEWDEINRLRDALASTFGGDDSYSLDQHGRNRDGYNSDEYDIFLKAGPMAVELHRQHEEGRSEVVGTFNLGEDLPDWQRAILDKFRSIANGEDQDEGTKGDDHSGWGTSGWD